MPREEHIRYGRAFAANKAERKALRAIAKAEKAEKA
jgi:hypothetical protein